MAFVSIITPLFNKGPYVAETIRSAQAQTFADWEMIVVDNGSTDDGPKRVRRLAADDRRVRLVSSLKRGLGATRNFGLYFSADGFSSDIVPEKWRLLLSLNPMVGVIDGFRWCLLRGESPLSISALSFSVFVKALLCVSGIWYFRKMERTFADVI